jgi:hypothetical protein
MNITKVLSFLFSLFFLAPALLFVTACSEKDGRQSGHAPESRAPVFDAKGPAWPVVALLKTGENPLWFELVPEGLSLIESPALSSLTPYAPWPHARFIVDMQAWEGCVVMAANRDGFIILGGGGEAPETGNAAARNSDVLLYRAEDSAFWDSYTAESFFVWDGKPAALLYRNDFFVEPPAPAAPPQVYVLDRASPRPLGVTVPALEGFPPGGSWETEAVRRGPDGLWYYRMKEKGKALNETAYFRAADLAGEGERISIGAWRNSGYPETPERIPPALADMLFTAASALKLEKTPAIRAVSPAFEGPRLVWAAPAPAEDLALLYGYCDETGAAVAVLPDGRGLYSRGKEPGFRAFSLPALPENFAYTGVALCGNALVAAWEEQQGAWIGAAGFMAMSFAAVP